MDKPVLEVDMNNLDHLKELVHNPEVYGEAILALLEQWNVLNTDYPYRFEDQDFVLFFNFSSQSS